MTACPHLAVSCRGLVKAFGEGDTRTPVLRGVDLAIAAGEMTLLVGPSGCGKTTLISIIAGMMSSDQGSVEVFGESVTKVRRQDLARFRARMIGFVFQQANLLPSLSALENAAVPLIIAGARKRDAYARANACLEQLGLAAHLRNLPAELSGGQQQRVAVARALVHEPRLLVCDEPTASLDSEAGQGVMQLLRDVAVEPNRAVIVVTHDSRIFSFADRIVRMVDGRIVASELARVDQLELAG
jgi:putative ABC transport system ATP-binding protein